MNTGSRTMFFVLVCLALAISACGASPTEGSPSSTAPESTVNAPAQNPDTAIASPALSDPTSATVAPTGEDLSEADILQIVRSSLAAYPWRLDQSILLKSTQKTSTSLTEVQSSTRAYSQSVQAAGSETVTVESMLIDSTFYLKITGSGVAETYGVPDGQWVEVPPDSPLSQLIDRSALDPAQVAELFVTDFAAVSGGSGMDELLFQAAGSEEVNGVATTIYESKVEAFTYRWWIGADGRFYKTTLDLPDAKRTIVVEYDPSISLQAPIP